jgi:hypothetical protein
MLCWAEPCSETLFASGLCCEQGEAKSAELIGQAIANNPAFLALRQIEAAREISHTISASANKVFLDSNDLLLNLQQLNVSGKQKKWCRTSSPFLWVIAVSSGCLCTRHGEERSVLDVVSPVFLWSWNLASMCSKASKLGRFCLNVTVAWGSSIKNKFCCFNLQWLALFCCLLG